MVVADNPRPDLWPQALIERGDLIVASTTETHGPERQVVAETRRHTFEAALAEARALGYSGLRVAADNTSLISGPERLEAWKDWESVADRFMAENPVTGMCAFDRSRAQACTVAALRRLHAVSVDD